MKQLLVLICLALLCSCGDQSTTTESSNLTYPITNKVDTIDTYFGQSVPDPYRWLEDDRSEETGAWVAAQNKVTQGYLSAIDFRQEVANRLMKLENYEKITAPDKSGDYYYYRKNDGLQNQSVIYRTTDLEKEPEVFIDPNTFSEDGTTALSTLSFNEEGDMAAYSISIAGSDWREIFVMDAKTGQRLSDHLKWVKFSGISWYQDGFYYQGFDEPDADDALKGTTQFGKIYYHTVGTDQSEDELIYSNPDNPENRFSADVTKDDQYLVIYSAESTSGNALYIKDLGSQGSQFITLVDNFDNDHKVIGTNGDELLIETNYKASNNRLVSVSLDYPTPGDWQTLIPEKEQVLSAAIAGNKIMASYLVDAKTASEQYALDGTFEKEVALPAIGTVYGFDAAPDEEEFYYTFTSFTEPASIYKYDIPVGESTLWRRPEIDFDPDQYETKQIFYTSQDGTKVPMFIVHKKELELNGKNPTWLYSYGGFNISLRPSFSASRIAWLENGGVFAMPNIRGGGEYGEEWHEAGTKQKKLNVFNDFIAAGEYLISEGYTSSEYLALQGGSNGGLLVGATINMRPELASVAFPMVGVMDMLRYQYFTVGRAWATDYGTSEDSREMFEYLYSYSPIHNISETAEYPAVMVTTADHDDRVVPAHSFKYAATLQEKRANNQSPLLIRIETNAGHGAGMSMEKRIQLTADMYSFAWYNMGIIPPMVQKNM